MSGATLERAELFDVFSNARRRHAVRYLIAEGGSCSLGPLVEQVAAWENDLDPDDVTRTQRRRVYISLYQTHLPMLADYGIVDWNPDAHAIELKERADRFEPFLEEDTGQSARWPRVYGTVIGAGLVALTAVLVSPISTGAVPVVVVGLCVAVLGIALVHRQRRRTPVS